MEKASSLLKRLHYRFQEPSLLQTALTHSSCGQPNNERLEYLGDSVIGMFIAEQLYHRYPALDEGHLSKLRTTLVRNSTLAELAKTLDLEKYIIVGQAEMKSGHSMLDSIMSNALEALVGAIYLDGGTDAAFSVLKGLYAERLKEVNLAEAKDPKTQLQEYMQMKNQPLPEYTLEKVDGKAHNPTFTISCKITSPKLKCTVSDRTRKRAEQGAAQEMLGRLNIQNA